MRRCLLPVLCLTLLLAGGCGWFEDKLKDQIPDFDGLIPDSLGDLGIPDLTELKGVGESCTVLDSGATDCRIGLRCVDAECKAVGASAENTPCILSDECSDGLYCGFVGVCQPSGEGPEGAPCSTGGECSDGLFCRIVGFSGICQQTGSADLGQPCGTTGDCLGGLVCGTGGSCNVGSLAFGYTPWPGVTCSSEEGTGAPVVHFEIPRGDVTEFFRLPFPNDIRMRNGRVALDGFPTPGEGLIGFDPVRRVIDAAEAVQRGFSSVPVTFFRFSHTMDLDSIEGDPGNGDGDPVTLRYVDIDPDSSRYGVGRSFGWSSTTGGGKYICPRFVEVRVPWEAPLSPETTYAVLLEKGVKTADGRAFEADADFKLMMSDSRPSDGVEAAAWDAYAPLRAYLDEQAIPRGDVLAAAVFTIEPSTERLPALREAVHAAAMPVATGLTLCAEGTQSPCEDGLSGETHVRGCFGAVAEVHELQLKLTVPKVQEGTRPYLEPKDGGGMVVGADGKVALQGTEDICLSLTIPKGKTMPATGWPLAIYGHGTNGTFRSSVANLGVPLASVDVAGKDVGFAVVGWDGPMHGDRRGAEFDPEPLFFNIGNPEAAMGNVYQGVADVYALVRGLGSMVIAAADSPTGDEIRFDTGHVAYVGHSQGSQYGPLALPYEPDLGMIVLSGAGAGLVRAILNKTNPVDAKLGAAVALGEFGNQGVFDIGERHPALTLVQGLFGAVDPLNQGRLLVDAPLEGAVARHALHVYGLDDTFTPPASTELMARVMRVPLVHTGTGNPPRTIPGVNVVAPPQTLNLANGTATGAIVEAVPATGVDGHFVLFTDSALRAQVTHFMASWVAEGAPTVDARPGQ